MTAKLRPFITRKSILVAFGVLALMILLPRTAHAAPGDLGDTIVNYFLQLVGELAKLIMKLMGFILLLLVKALVEVAQYSNFVAPGPTAVRIGWLVTRDLANMFFIVVLLISAFSTIIGYSKYRYDAVLPRLLITAVMINFSKTIVGLLIDFSQVIMLTFVNGFASAAGGNFLNAFQVNKLLALSSKADPISLDTVGLLLGLFFAVIMVTVSVAIVLLLTIHLVARVVNLWVLIIMAPIAFIAKVIPGLDSMYGEWWSKLIKLLISGPKIAFFIWLALITAQQSGGAVSNNDGFVKQTSAASAQELASAQAATPGIPTDAATSDTILSMIIMIAILMAGLQEAQTTVNSDPIAKGIKSRLQGAKNRVQRFGVDRAKQAGRGTVNLAARGAGFASGKISSSKFGQFVGQKRDQFAGSAAGKYIMPKTRATYLRQQAAEERRQGNVDKAKELERSAGRWDTYARIKGVATTVGTAGLANVPGAIKRGVGAVQEKDDKELAKKIDDAGKGMQPPDALDLVNGKKVAGSQNELIAAYKKAIESDKMDPETIAAGRIIMAGADADSLRAFNKTAKEKHGVYFDENGNLDNVKRDKELREGDADPRKWTKKARAAYLNETANTATAANEDAPTAVANVMRKYNIKPSDVPLDTLEKSPIVADAVLQFTKTNAASLKDVSESSREALAKRMTDPTSGSNVANAQDGMMRGTNAWQGLALGSLKQSDLTPTLLHDMAQVDQRSVASFVNAAPIDNAGIQQAISTAMTGYVKYGTPQSAQGVMSNPSLSGYVSDADVAKIIDATRDGNVSRVISDGGRTITDLDRRRKDAERVKDVTLAATLQTQMDALRAGAADLRTAGRDMSDAARDIVTQQQEYGRAAQAYFAAGATPAVKSTADTEMRKIGKDIANALDTIATKRDALAIKVNAYEKLV